MLKAKVVFIMLIFLSFSLAVIHFPSINSEKNKIDGKVLDVVDNGDEARVIIKFKDSEQGKNEIKDVLKEKIKHDFGDRISATVSERDLREIEGNPDIEFVELVNTRQIFLQDSVPLVNATQTWNLQVEGINLTGKGETVCVIDTGIYYNHTDFGNCFGENNASSGCKILGGFDYCADDTTCTTVDSDPIDVHGHGTHVSGIVAANGSIKGVAPDANIIMIKAANSTGTLFDDDIRKAIDWCVSNSSIFNISVISMSFGGGLYDTYCDDDSEDTEDITGAINNAIANNISVVVASGNDNNSTHISFPACIQNSTAVGSSTKVDAISSFSNRNNITDLIAPGTDITSTANGGGYVIASGTSMATPHVSGALALIHQFKELSGRNITLQEMQDALNTTGKQINDSGASNLNYSRIQVYQAIMSLNETPFSITLVSPENNTYTNLANTNFTCSQTTASNLTNSTFMLWNSTALIYNETENISGASNQTTFNYTFSIETEYLWNCNAFNSSSNSAEAESNFTITYDITEPNITIISPENNTEYTGTTDVIFQYNVSEINLDVCNLTINNVIEGTNNSINTSITNQFIESLSEGSYNWSVLCADLAGNSNETENRIITVNSAPQTPSDGGSSSSRNSVEVVSPKEETISNVELKEGVSKEMGKKDNILFTINNTIHKLTLAEIQNQSVIVTLESEPINISLIVNETRKVDIDEDNYYELELKLNSIENSQANLTIKEIYEEIPSRQISLDEETAQENFLGKIKNDKILISIIVAVGISSILLLIVLLVEKKQDKGLKPKKQKKLEH